MLRTVLLIKSIHVEPAVIHGVAGRPDNGGDPRLREIQRGSAKSYTTGQVKLAGGRFFRQIQTIGRNVGICGIQ